MIDVEAYLRRINYVGRVEPDLPTLKGLHQAHVCAVPFENLNIHYDMPIALQQSVLFDKIVSRQRGGFCYELNGLFADLLLAIGFELQRLSARVARSSGGFGPEFDHLTLLIKLDESWLVDIGFGDSFLLPLQWKIGSEQKQGSDWFNLAEEGERVVLNRKRQAQEWKAAYSISTEPRRIEDFFEMCEFHSNAPESPFRKHKIVRLEQQDGRLSLLDGQLKIVSFSGEDRDLDFEEDSKEYFQMLHDYFGLKLGG